MTKVGVVTFPGSLDDHDAQRAVTLAGATPVCTDLIIGNYFRETSRLSRNNTKVVNTS